SVYTIGILTFLIGSTLAGFSASMQMLNVSRLIQGVGAGAQMPIATTIVGDISTKRERAKIQGYLSSVWGISAILGPLIGAFFVDFLNWRYVFWMNIPLGLLSMAGILIFLKENIKKEKQPVDYIGAALMMVGVSALMYILVEGGVGIAWLSRQMAILFAIVLASFALFFLYEKRVQEPIMPASIWEYRLIKIAKDRKSTRLNSSTLRSRMPSSAC